MILVLGGIWCQNGDLNLKENCICDYCHFSSTVKHVLPITSDQWLA
jgi:hypothetical protein